MKVAYKHLVKLLDEQPDINDLSLKLFQLGHEHEIVNNILDIEFTPNRGDCLSLLGLARDLSVFYKSSLDLNEYKDPISSLDLNFKNHSNAACPKISFLKIEIDKDISEYKDYLQSYFDDLKINKNNFFTDVSNYLAYEMGQPTHCYDFSSLEGELAFKETNFDANIEFETLLGSKINLKGINSVFTLDNKVINLAGVVGGMKTSCSKNTNTALIECAYFNPESIIGKSVKYNIHSDASHKFERGVDVKCQEKVLRRFISIVNDHTNITNVSMFTEDSKPITNHKIKYNLDKINKILGTEISDNRYKEILTALGFLCKDSIEVPSYRTDVRHQNDLAEEVARVIGYNNIPIVKLNIPKKPNKEVSLENSIRSYLVDNGFYEVINAPFINNNHSHSIKVDNPLDSNREYLRTNISDSLIENILYNEKRQQDSIKLFEISDIYTFNNGNVDVVTNLAIIVSGRRGSNHRDFSLKLDEKYLEELFMNVDIAIPVAINKIDKNKLDTKVKAPVFVFEIEVKNFQPKVLHEAPKLLDFLETIQYRKISDFPSTFRDISFLIKEPSQIDILKETIGLIKDPILKDSFIFDYYNDEKANNIKIGFRFIFQSYETTSTDVEVNIIFTNIVNMTKAIDGIKIPGVL